MTAKGGMRIGLGLHEGIHRFFSLCYDFKL